jgi:hypothetical protein
MSDLRPERGATHGILRVNSPRLSLCLAGLLCLGTSVSSAEDPGPDSAQFFEERIRPIFAANCVKCHGEAKQKGALRLDSHATLLSGGEEGPAVVPGAPDQSLLIKAVRYEGLEMPPKEPLPEKDVAALTSWVAAGAPWPEHSEPIREGSNVITDADRAWWAFQPLVKPDVPDVTADRWSRNGVDRFIYGRLADEKMVPAARAEKEVLVRRLYFDLIGVPPTPDEMDAFVNDPSPYAWELLIDTLLEDPRYGEHWARFWLDLVRYAESDGWNKDSYRPHIWRYRDYVVNALNGDKPYPEFVRQQLAGDEIEGDNPENLFATGYLRLGIYEYNQRDARSHWNDIMNEITDVTGNAFLGLSMSCSRCHDHKFDPLMQTDYFSLRAFFEPLTWRNDLIGATEAEKVAWSKKNAKWEEATTAVRAEIDALLAPLHKKKWASTVDKFPLDVQACFNTPVEERDSLEHQLAYLVERQFYEEAGGPLSGMSKEDKAKHEELKKKLAEFNTLKPKPLPAVMAATDFAGPPSPTLIPKDATKTPIEPRFLLVMAKDGQGEKPDLAGRPDSTGRRTALAEWIGRDDNPLTTRVIVNRIWQQHFGEGIVPSASDFGHLGQPPSHPGLLDWLTANFVEGGWRFKALHKTILMSATWQQRTDHPKLAEYQEKDPGGELLWRREGQRLRAEQVRDAMLAASGELDGKVGGPSVDTGVPRRALYVKIKRNSPDSMLHTFDMAGGLSSVSQRIGTTTPTQALLMINGDYVLARAKKLGGRMRNCGAETCAGSLTHGFRLAWGRYPTDAELDRALEYIGVNRDTHPKEMISERLIDFSHVLLNSNEFLYID